MKIITCTQDSDCPCLGCALFEATHAWVGRQSERPDVRGMMVQVGLFVGRMTLATNRPTRESVTECMAALEASTDAFLECFADRTIREKEAREDEDTIGAPWGSA